MKIKRTFDINHLLTCTREFEWFKVYFEKHFKSYMENKKESWEVNFETLDNFIKEIQPKVKISTTNYWDKPYQYNTPAHVYQLSYITVLVFVNHNNLLEIGDLVEIEEKN